AHRTAELTYTPKTAGTLTLNTQAQGAGTDPAPGDDSASADVTVAPFGSPPDLNIKGLDTPDPPAVGKPYTYTYTVDNNNGPGTATGVQVVDDLPASLNLVSATTSDGNACDVNGQIVTCVLGSLPHLQTKTVSITVTPTVVTD